METMSLKALSMLRLQGNRQGNNKETLSFHKETSKETATGNGGVSALPVSPPAAPTDYPPVFKIWLTTGNELRTTGVCDDLAGEIIKLTSDNLPLQALLLRRHVEKYQGVHWKYLVEEWNERAGIMQYDGGMTRQEAEQAAAKYYRIEAFIDELTNHTTTGTAGI